MNGRQRAEDRGWRTESGRRTVLSSALRRPSSAVRPPTSILTSLVLIGLLALASAATALGSSGQADDGYERINPQGLQPIEQINEALHRWGPTALAVGGVLLGIAVLKIIGPARIYDNLNERRLAKTVRGVDDLIKRIQAEAETNSSESKEAPADGGLLTAMIEMAEFNEAEQVPAYVLTVNDLALDNIRSTLHGLQRFTGGNADRYRNYMFSVLKGIKTITEESRRSGAPSSLAVDVEDYFRDDSRYHAWEKLLRRAGRKGDHKEIAQAFLLFMRNVREGKPLVAPVKSEASTLHAAAVSVPPASKVPQVLNEETLPLLQHAAAKEAGNFISLVQTGKLLPTHDSASLSWQFEFVRRQQQLHLRDEAQRMLGVFLDCERKDLPRITKTKMLPCRTWQHTLHLLGVENGPVLEKRVEEGWLTIQEIVILQKAFLQTFGKKASLEHVYGVAEEADLMMNLHIPQIRRESLRLLRRCAQAEPTRFDRATKTLNDEETPQHNEVAKLIQHYVRDQHDPPGIAAEQ